MAKEVPKKLIKSIQKVRQETPLPDKGGQEKLVPARGGANLPKERAVAIDQGRLEKALERRLGPSVPIEAEGPSPLDQDKWDGLSKKTKESAYPLDEIVEIKKLLQSRNKSDLNEAIPKIDELIKRYHNQNPNYFAEALALRGKAEHYLGNEGAALRHYGKAHERDPENPDIAHDYALLLLSAERYGEALPLLEQYQKQAIDAQEAKEIAELLAAVKKLAA